MKALIVKEDGLIYAAEVPKEPNITDYGDDEYLYPLAHYTYDMEDYEAALTSAKESAVLVSDQEKARELIIRKGSISRDKDGFYQPIVGVHPIPDLDWTTVDVKIARILSTDGKHKQMPLTGPVAILKESSTEQESQEELWKAVSNEINDEGLWLYDDYVGFTINAKGFAYLMKQFTITRKP